MYDDYKPTYISEFRLLPEIWLGIFVVLGLITIIMLVSMWRIFRKAEKKGWYALVPFYNLVVLLQIANMPSWQVILYFIPLANFYPLIMVPLNLAKVFHKSSKFGWGLALLPIVYYPILAFNKQAYMGINKDADFSTSVDPNQVLEPSVSQEAAKAEEQEEKPQYPKPNITVGLGSNQVAFAVPKEAPNLIETPKQEPPLASFQVPSAPTNPTVFMPTQSTPEQVEKPKQEIPSFVDSFAQLTPTQNMPTPPVENPVSQPEPKTDSTPEPKMELPKFPMPEEKEEFVTCEHCGAVLKKGAPRCFLCGTPLKK